jgi:hypothetical protein
MREEKQRLGGLEAVFASISTERLEQHLAEIVSHLEMGHGAPSTANTVRDALKRLHEIFPVGFYTLFEARELVLEVHDYVMDPILHMFSFHLVPPRKELILHTNIHFTTRERS